MKYILLVSLKNRFTFGYIQEKNAEVQTVYRKDDAGKAMRLFRKAMYFSCLKWGGWLYGDWVKEIRDPEVQIIVFDECKANFRLRRVLKEAARRPILYYWNPIRAKEKRFLNGQKKVFDLWTFDRQDALKYGIGYNHQFVPYVRLERENRFDFSFIGVDKGRYAENKRIFDLLRENFRCFFYIVGNGEDEVFHREEMPYSEYLRYEAESACILDVVQKNQTGWTLRVIESLINQKKLLSNNREILRADFYRPENILVFDGKTTAEEIKSFLLRPFIPYNEEVIEEYLVGSWIRRFGREE